jgi:hypothetical protein
MMRLLPRFYDWMMRSKLLRVYGELRFLENEMTDARIAGREMGEMIARLDRLEEQATISKRQSLMRACFTCLRDHIASCAQA